MAYFDRIAAKQSGYTDEEINAYLTTMQPSTGITGSNILSKIAGVATDVLVPQTKKFIQQYPEYVKKQISLGTPKSPGEYIQRLGEGTKMGLKTGTEIASFGVPFGKGAGILGKAVLPGAAVGVLRGISEEEATPESIAGSTLGGAVTGGALGVLGKGVGAVGKGLTKTGESLAVKTIRPSKTQLFKFKEQYKIDLPKVLQKYKLVGKDAQQIMDEAIQPRQQEFDTIVNMSGLKVAKNEITKQFNSIIRTLKQSPANEDKALASQLMVEMQNVIGKAKGGAIDISKLNNFRQIYDSKVGGWIGSPIEAGRNRLTGNALRKAIQETVDKLGIKTPSGLSLKEVGLELSKLYGIHDLVALQQNLSRGNLPFGLLQLLGFIGGGSLASFPGAGVGALIPQLANAPQVVSTASKTATKLGSGIQNIPGGDLIKKLATIGVVSSRGINKQAEYEPQYPKTNQFPHTPSITQQGNWVENPDGSWSQTTTQEPIQGREGYPSKEEFERTMFNDLQTTGGKNLAELQSVYKVLYPEVQKKPLTSVQQTLMANTNSALRALDKVETLVKQDPNIILKGAAPGIIGRLAGASTYNTAKKEIADVIGRLRTGAVINDEEMRTYLGKLPEVGDRPEDIAYKINEMRNIFSELRTRIENQSGAQEYIINQ